MNRILALLFVVLVLTSGCQPTVEEVIHSKQAELFSQESKIRNELSSKVEARKKHKEKLARQFQSDFEKQIAVTETVLIQLKQGITEDKIPAFCSQNRNELVKYKVWFSLERDILCFQKQVESLNKLHAELDKFAQTNEYMLNDTYLHDNFPNLDLIIKEIDSLLNGTEPPAVVAKMYSQLCESMFDDMQKMYWNKLSNTKTRVNDRVKEIEEQITKLRNNKNNSKGLFAIACQKFIVCVNIANECSKEKSEFQSKQWFPIAKEYWDTLYDIECQIEYIQQYNNSSIGIIKSLAEAQNLQNIKNEDDLQSKFVPIHEAIIKADLWVNKDLNNVNSLKKVDSSTKQKVFRRLENEILQKQAGELGNLIAKRKAEIEKQLKANEPQQINIKNKLLEMACQNDTISVNIAEQCSKEKSDLNSSVQQQWKALYDTECLIEHKKLYVENSTPVIDSLNEVLKNPDSAKIHEAITKANSWLNKDLTNVDSLNKENPNIQQSVSQRLENEILQKQAGELGNLIAKRKADIENQLKSDDTQRTNNKNELFKSACQNDTISVNIAEQCSKEKPELDSSVQQQWKALYDTECLIEHKKLYVENSTPVIDSLNEVLKNPDSAKIHEAITKANSWLNKDLTNVDSLNKENPNIQQSVSQRLENEILQKQAGELGNLIAKRKADIENQLNAEKSTDSLQEFLSQILKTDKSIDDILKALNEENPQWASEDWFKAIKTSWDNWKTRELNIIAFERYLKCIDELKPEPNVNKPTNELCSTIQNVCSTINCDPLSKLTDDDKGKVDSKMNEAGQFAKEIQATLAKLKNQKETINQKLQSVKSQIPKTSDIDGVHADVLKADVLKKVTSQETSAVTILSELKLEKSNLDSQQWFTDIKNLWQKWEKYEHGSQIFCHQEKVLNDMVSELDALELQFTKIGNYEREFTKIKEDLDKTIQTENERIAKFSEDEKSVKDEEIYTKMASEIQNKLVDSISQQLAKIQADLSQKIKSVNPPVGACQKSYLSFEAELISTKKTRKEVLDELKVEKLKEKPSDGFEKAKDLWTTWEADEKNVATQNGYKKQLEDFQKKVSAIQEKFTTFKQKNQIGELLSDPTFDKKAMNQLAIDVQNLIEGKTSCEANVHDSMLKKVEEIKFLGDKKIMTVNGVEFVFRWCPPGTFTMGSPEGEEGRENHWWKKETQHKVTLTKGFWIMETEVTQKQWEAVYGTKHECKFTGDNLPIEVSWDDCERFFQQCTVLKLPFCLPTEAQWEYACRAGTTGRFAGILDEMGWYRKNSDKKTHPVGQKKANAWGLYDMHGNVCELCQDVENDYPETPQTDPVTNGTKAHVFRGGSWYFHEDQCRSASRISEWNGPRHGHMGFRCVLKE